MITRLMAFVLAFGVAQQTSAARPLKGRLDYWPAGIFQIIEKRAGRSSCWGVVIQLRGMRLRGLLPRTRYESSKANMDAI